MLSIQIGLVIHLLAIAFGAEINSAEDGKAVAKLKLEPAKIEDDRAKRASEGGAEGARTERQSIELPNDYYNLLQQLNGQGHQQQAQPLTPAQQPQQYYIPEFPTSSDGSKASAPGPRYFLSPDGNVYPEGHPALAQYESYLSSQPQPFNSALGGPAYVQSPLDQTSPQTLPSSPPQELPPGIRPRISEFARQQQRLLQEYRDAPLRAQIAGFARGPQPQRPAQPVPTGPTSQSAQVFASPSGQNQRQNPEIPPQNPGLGSPVDSQAYLQQQFAQQPQQQFPQIPQQQFAHLPQQQFAQLPQQQFAHLPQQQFAQQPQQQFAHLPQQQFAQQPQPQFVQLPHQQLATQYDPDGNQVYSQSTQRTPVSLRLYYHQPGSVEQKFRGSPNALTFSSAIQPQFAPQSLPQQYFLESGKQSSGQAQFVPQDFDSQIQYIQQPIQQQQPQPKPVRPETDPRSTLHQAAGGRGYYNPSRQPSRSSIFVSRSSVPKTLSLTVTEGVSSEKVPVVQHQSPSEQRGYTQQDLDSLLKAGYTVTSGQNSHPSQYLKRQPQSPSEEGTNHVHYENPQDGVQYQYSPGTSDSRITIKTKKSISEDKVQQP